MKLLFNLRVEGYKFFFRNKSERCWKEEKAGEARETGPKGALTVSRLQ